jgi:phage baseplate assembly protein W
MPSVAEVQITGGGWGGDFALDSTGDLILSQDTSQVPQATIERLTRLVLTCANLTDQYGNVIGWADDIHHPNWGAGIRAYVNATFNQTTFQNITNAIQAQLAVDPAVAIQPQPQVSLTQQGTYGASLQIQFKTQQGQLVVLPTINLTPTNVSLNTGG